MKRIAVFAGIVVVLGIATVVFAQMGRGGDQRGMGPNMKMAGDSTCAMPMMGMAMGMVGARQVVPVSDGIIVSIGNKLVKFDNNLNKRKEMQLELTDEDLEMMQEQMQRARAVCSNAMSDTAATVPPAR
jgi:hypothetical protein